MEWDSINSIPSFLLTGLSRSGVTTSYEYDINGRRTKKVANGVTTEYYYSGEQYTGMHTSDGKDVGAILDASGGLYGIYYDDSTIGTDVGQTYYFVYNGQGDVIGLYNHGGKLIATYAYDAWGRCIEAKAVTADDDGHAVTDPDHIAFINPFRYRGYMYDAESGLYYLGSRYYDPETGRFINADGLLGANGDTLSYNLFAYCSNNPIINSDPTGMGIGDFFKKIGKGLSDFGNAVVNTTKKIVHCIKASFDVHLDSGFGIGVKTKVMGIGVEAEALPVHNEIGYNSQDGMYDNTSASISVKAEATNIVSVGGEAAYKGPTDKIIGSEEGMIANPDMHVEYGAGLSIGNTLIGASNIESSDDFVISWGQGFYFIAGGGYEVSINISAFMVAWDSY